VRRQGAQQCIRHCRAQVLLVPRTGRRDDCVPVPFNAPSSRTVRVRRLQQACDIACLTGREASDSPRMSSHSSCLAATAHLSSTPHRCFRAAAAMRLGASRSIGYYAAPRCVLQTSQQRLTESGKNSRVDVLAALRFSSVPFFSSPRSPPALGHLLLSNSLSRA
jgi:hypothetical protein